MSETDNREAIEQILFGASRGSMDWMASLDETRRFCILFK
jgi:hypothetical protein